MSPQIALEDLFELHLSLPPFTSNIYIPRVIPSLLRSKISFLYNFVVF